MKKDTRVSHQKGASWVDCHLHAAMKVMKHEYFVVADVSSNECQGLLVGTEVKRVRDIDQWPSKYWNGMYYSCLVECPNGETRRLSCDVLTPRKTDRYFKKQSTLYANARTR